LCLQGPVVAYCDHAPFFASPLLKSIPSLGKGLKPWGPGLRDDGIKEDAVHLLVMKIGDKGMSQANANKGR
jgi:hypothetical protein